MVKKIEYDQNIMHYDIRKLNLNKKYLQQGIISADTRPTVGLGSPPLWEGIQSTIPRWSDRKVTKSSSSTTVV